MSPEALARLHAAAETDDRAWNAADFAGILDSPNALLITREERAFALARLVRDEGELLLLATDPAARRRGLARTCLVALHDAAAARGVARLHLEVRADNLAARTLYDFEGYVQTGLRHRYYRHGDGPAIDAILMARDLGVPAVGNASD